MPSLRYDGAQSAEFGGPDENSQCYLFNAWPMEVSLHRFGLTGDSFSTSL